MLNRRQFLQAAGLMLCSPSGFALEQASDRRLLLLELKGGNDALNTLIPYASSDYFRLRPTLAIKRDQVLQLDQHLGLHPQLQALMPAWQADELAWVQGLGYPQANRSHFRSIQIWETASAADQYLDQGWLAEPLRQLHNPARLADAVAIGKANLGGLHGQQVHNLIIDRADQFIRQARKLGSTDKPSSNPALAHLLQQRTQVRQSAQQLGLALPDLGKPQGKTPFERDLHLAAQLLSTPKGPRVVKVSLGSFDTHARQASQHARLLGQLAKGLSQLRETLISSGQWRNTLVMSYSEFGRRAAQNGSGGSDHGTAAHHLMLGGAVRGGLYGHHPSLKVSKDQDLTFQVDFRDWYAAIEQQWWQNSSSSAFEPFIRQA